MDRRFWESKRKIPFLNQSGEVIPAFAPVNFSRDWGFGTPSSPWVEGTTIRHNQLVYPISLGGLSDNGTFGAMFAINGPQDVQPNSYGECSMDYPLPLLIDPDSFPIYHGGSTPPTAGTWQEYLDITCAGGDCDGIPPCGLSAGVSPVVWPASFLPDVVLWKSLAFDRDADGSDSQNRVIVVPADSRAPIPYAANGTGNYTGNCDTTGQILVQPFKLVVDGLYLVQVSASLGIKQVGTEADLRIGYIPGPNQPPLANNIVAHAPGINYIATLGRTTVDIEMSAGDNTATIPFNLYEPASGGDPQSTILGTIGPVTDDTDKLNILNFGTETLSFSVALLGWKNDQIQLDVICPGASAPIVVSAQLVALRIGDNPISNSSQYLGQPIAWTGATLGF